METDQEQKPFVPASMVDYAPQGIVSRVILRRPNGSVTLFAFDAGQELSEHTAPFEALLSVVEGRATVFIDRREYVVGSGETVPLPAGVPHAVRANEPFKMMLTMVR